MISPLGRFAPCAPPSPLALSEESATFVNGVLDQVAGRLGLKAPREGEPAEGDG